MRMIFGNGKHFSGDFVKMRKFVFYDSGQTLNPREKTAVLAREFNNIFQN